MEWDSDPIINRDVATLTGNLVEASNVMGEVVWVAGSSDEGEESSPEQVIPALSRRHRNSDLPELVFTAHRRRRRSDSPEQVITAHRRHRRSDLPDEVIPSLFSKLDDIEKIVEERFGNNLPSELEEKNKKLLEDAVLSATTFASQLAEKEQLLAELTAQNNDFKTKIDRIECEKKNLMIKFDESEIEKQKFEKSTSELSSRNESLESKAVDNGELTLLGPPIFLPR